jgi:peptidyl-prolyl cis-trans isomerase SurA
MTIKNVCLLSLLLLALAMPASAQTLPRDLLIDRILAVVDDDVVMLSELRAATLKLSAQLRDRGISPMPSDAAIQKQAFDSLVMNKLQLAEAARLGIDADEVMVSRAVASVAANNGLTVPQLRGALEAEGLDFETFRGSLRDELIIRRLRSREVTSRIQVTTSEIDSYLERHGGSGRQAIRIDYIRIDADEAEGEARERARLLATDIAERLRNGESFATLANAHSNDPSAARGGDLGWLALDNVPSLFQKYAATTEKGEIEGPIATQRGFHLFRVNDIRYDGANIVEQTNARHILIRTDEVTSDDDARQRLMQLRQRIVKGDDFDTLARANSDDKASAIDGGDLGWSTPGNLVPAFEEQMDALAPGEVSQPFKTEFGWHIVQVLGRRDYDVTDETRRDAARKAVRDAKADEALESYLRRLRDEAYIELRLEDLG